MSWQRILELARQRNLPVIVTDVAGREPMVILPLSEYENYADQARLPSKVSGIQNRIESPEAEAFVAFETEELQKQVDAAIPNLSQPPQSDQGLSLEERFYLEPVDEESK